MMKAACQVECSAVLFCNPLAASMLPPAMKLEAAKIPKYGCIIAPQAEAGQAPPVSLPDILRV